MKDLVQKYNQIFSSSDSSIWQASKSAVQTAVVRANAPSLSTGSSWRSWSYPGERVTLQTTASSWRWPLLRVSGRSSSWSRRGRRSPYKKSLGTMTSSSRQKKNFQRYWNKWAISRGTEKSSITRSTLQPGLRKKFLAARGPSGCEMNRLSLEWSVADHFKAFCMISSNWLGT